MVNILFCVLRNADPHIENIPTGENVNMVLHEYQEQFANSSKKGKKAFVYQTDNRIIVQEFGALSSDEIFLMDVCRENKSYSYCLATAFATMDDFASKNPYDENYLIILMQNPIKYQDSIFFLEYLVPEPTCINHHVILIQHENGADDKFCDFIENDKNYSKENFFIHKTMTFSGLCSDRSGYDLCL